MVRPQRFSLLLVAATFFSGCKTPELDVYNLREVHHADGRPARRGAVHSPWQHIFAEAFRFSFTANGAQQAVGGKKKMKRIEDPLGECFESLRDLLGDSGDGEAALGYAVEMVTWLGGDCTFELSREACARALEDLGSRVGVNRPLQLGDGVEPQAPEEVASALEDILRETRLALSGDGAAGALAEACALADREPLDRDGARRLLAASNVVLERAGAGRPSLEPLRELRVRLEPVCIGLTLATVLEDPAPRVRAAAMRSWIGLTEGRDPAPLETAFQDPASAVLLEAIRSLALHGVPVPEGAAAGQLRAADDLWMARVASLLGRLLDGPLLVASCQAMSTISGEPADLHPEVWVAWWEDRGAPEAAPGSPPRETAP